MSSLIVGVKTRAQIEQAIAAASLAISPEHFARIDQAFPGPWKQPDPLRG
jgi:aryl-alcohol dehydrogenase-like predicted oxidoreductase